MKNRLLKLAAVLILMVATAVITWHITILTLKIEVNEDTAYITSFGQTDEFDYMPLWHTGD
ncbi:hypothetical protein CLHUN_02410 [Ruminiclostridium hungatei]|uniref:Uncharacterized protein n=1 Tax=Ruminiclostridium hungatei TaxID=48256 RepID=A0A1V4SSJ4_RUMHU|nr:hypothetical protein [Ruminiclostridium hungatei]OPX46425.1 hypothetical protein CLHUN_02410 [Ruminiclostridium hungatei]